MNHKRIRVATIALVALLTVSAAFAQGGKGAGKGAGKAKAGGAQQADQHLVATVVSTTGDALTVKAAKGENLVYQVGPAATVTDYKEIKKADLATGQWLKVQGTIASDGSSIAAAQVVVVSEQPPSTSLAPAVGMEVGQLTVKGDQLRLRTAEKEMTVVVNDQTQYYSRPKIAVAELKAGALVAIEGRDVAGENVATIVAVEPDAQAAKADAADLKAATKADKPARGAGKGAGKGGKANKGANVGV